jgi:phosphoglycerol transferase MdoB-like AlkP superfamily enzyme
MKFLLSKNLHSNPSFRLLLGSYALLMLLYFAGDLVYLAHFFGSSPQAIILTLQGNPEEFTEPLDLLALLEQLHIGLFLGVLALFSTLAILLRLNLSNKHKMGIIFIAMSTLLISALSLLATYFIAPFFAYLLYPSTLLWHLSGLYTLLILLYQLGFKKA